VSRILIVEDSDSIALLLKRRLEMAGHSTVRASNGADALERLGRGERVDLVLLDETMPRLSGSEALGELRLVHPGLPVIMVTGTRPGPGSQELADAIVRKPIDFDQLLGLVERLA
jgi:CheY-like chemotaxis protein